MTIAAFVVDLLRLYAIIGGVIAIAFLCVGIGRVDPAARGAFLPRLMFVPGVIGLWPLVLVRWWQLERLRAEEAEDG